jgi:hypothetical protein
MIPKHKIWRLLFFIIGLIALTNTIHARQYIAVFKPLNVTPILELSASNIGENTPFIRVK